MFPIAGLETRRAWFEAVAAQQFEQYHGEVLEAAEAGAELGRRMATAGNFSRRDQLREQVFHADAVAQLARARAANIAALLFVKAYAVGEAAGVGSSPVPPIFSAKTPGTRSGSGSAESAEGKKIVPAETNR